MTSPGPEVVPPAPPPMDEAAVRAAMERQAPAVAYAIKSEQHLLVAVASYVLPAEAASNPQEHVHLDPEHLLGVMLGCYVCGQPYTALMAKRRCPGPGRHA